MSVIINDFSLDGQFNDMEVFIDSLFNSTIPILDILESLKIQILGSYAIYNLKITKDTTLYDIIKIRGIPEITKFKKQLNELFFDEPFWESEPLSDIGSVYECNFSNKVSGYCLAEALERKNPVLSFEHDDFKDSAIVIKKDGVDSKINNLYNKETLIEVFREIGIIDSLKYLLLKHNLIYSFGLSLGKNYFKDLCEETYLKELFSKPLGDGKKRHIVFWYDSNEDFVEDIDNFDIENVKVVKLTNKNAFWAKYHIEKEDTTSNILVYANMEKPRVDEDFLYDIFRYSEEFTTDRATVIMRELKVMDASIKEEFKLYNIFFKNKERITLGLLMKERVR